MIVGAAEVADARVAMLIGGRRSGWEDVEPVSGNFADIRPVPSPAMVLSDNVEHTQGLTPYSPCVVTADPPE